VLEAGVAHLDFDSNTGNGGMLVKDEPERPLNTLVPVVGM